MESPFTRLRNLGSSAAGNEAPLKPSGEEEHRGALGEQCRELNEGWIRWKQQRKEGDRETESVAC